MPRPSASRCSPSSSAATCWRATTEPGTDRFGNIVVNRPRYPVNPRLLEEIADQTGGVPYLATDTNALQKRFQAILEDLDQLPRLKSQTPHYAELYPILIAPALEADPLWKFCSR